MAHCDHLFSCALISYSFAYGPADAMAISSSLASLKPGIVYLSGAGLCKALTVKGFCISR